MDGYHLMHVRKNRNKSHGTAIEASDNRKILKYIVLDDFMCSGKTVRSIIQKITRQSNQSSVYYDAYPEEKKDVAKCVAIVLYDQARTSTRKREVFTIGKGKRERNIPVFCLPGGIN